MKNFTTPVGRFVGGSLTKPQTTDAEGRPLVYKTGADAGKPRTSFFIAIAVPKGAEAHWNQTPWGAEIWNVGHQDFPQGQADHPAFAWKVEDGDSALPNKNGKKNCDREGYPRSWVLKFSSSFPSPAYNADGSAKIEPESIKPGYFIQINGDVTGNGSMQQPGVYLNHKMVALAAYGTEIVYGPDAADAGFGASPLPAGAMATPPAGFVPPVAAPAAPAPMAPPPAAPPAPPAPAFLQVPPPVAPARQMLPPSNGATYEQMIAAGWTDATLIQMGMMTA
ncbi:MAG: hypothetical protein B7Z31_00195 [Rhodobacterales bacterium 12-65-15]|nr:MAG: hypothetical protein B7Z31_00195 [Rhodobacterales bacterium 12-65-15]